MSRLSCYAVPGLKDAFGGRDAMGLSQVCTRSQSDALQAAGCQDRNEQSLLLLCRWSRMAGPTRSRAVRLAASFGVAPSTRVQWHAAAHWPGSEGSVFLLETERKQGWPVGLGRWDITKHWIWAYGLVSAARVGDAGDNSITISGSVAVARIVVATAATTNATSRCGVAQACEGAVASSSSSRRYGKRACRSQTPTEQVVAV